MKREKEVFANLMRNRRAAPPKLRASGHNLSSDEDLIKDLEVGERQGGD